MAEQDSQRLRQHPDLRFASPQLQFNLEATAAKLREELNAGEEGRRQQTLYKHGGTTISLFVFQRLTRLRPHRAQGVVSIHLLTGHLQVTAEGQAHDLHPGNLVILAPGVEHDLVALQESVMLLTVNLSAASPNSSIANDSRKA